MVDMSAVAAAIYANLARCDYSTKRSQPLLDSPQFTYPLNRI